MLAAVRERFGLPPIPRSSCATRTRSGGPSRGSRGGSPRPESPRARPRPPRLPAGRAVAPPAPRAEPAARPAPAPGAALEVAREQIRRAMLDELVRRTGYPEEMLDADLDLEAELGIDTVKQVAVIAAVRERFGLQPNPTFKLRDANTMRKAIEVLGAPRRGRADRAEASPGRPAPALGRRRRSARRGRRRGRTGDVRASRPHLGPAGHARRAAPRGGDPRRHARRGRARALERRAPAQRRGAPRPRSARRPRADRRRGTREAARAPRRGQRGRARPHRRAGRRAGGAGRDRPRDRARPARAGGDRPGAARGARADAGGRAGGALLGALRRVHGRRGWRDAARRRRGAPARGHARERGRARRVRLARGHRRTARGLLARIARRCTGCRTQERRSRFT